MTLKELQDQNKEHKLDVTGLLNSVTEDLSDRSKNHDHSKFVPENELKLLGCLNKETSWDVWEDVHYALEDHHPEYYINVADMPLTALLEMVCDGASAAFRRSPNKPEWEDQVNRYLKKGFDIQLSSILATEFMKYYEKLEQDSLS